MCWNHRAPARRANCEYIFPTLYSVTSCSSLKSALGAFTPQKSANATHEDAFTHGELVIKHLSVHDYVRETMKFGIRGFKFESHPYYLPIL